MPFDDDEYCRHGVLKPLRCGPCEDEVLKQGLPPICGRCGGWRPLPGFIHELSTDDDPDGVTCRPRAPVED